MRRRPPARTAQVIGTVPVGPDSLADFADPADPGWGVRRFGMIGRPAIGDRWAFRETIEGGWELAGPIEARATIETGSGVG